MFRPSVKPAQGRGTKRLYSFHDLLCLKVIKDLAHHGFSLQKIRRCLRPLRQYAAHAGPPSGSLKYVTDGEKFFVITSDRKKILNAMDSHFVLSLGIGNLVRELNGEVRRAAGDPGPQTRPARCGASKKSDRDRLELPMEPAKVTPMMQQYLQIKERYRDAILFFRLGDFYEMFFEDAETAARNSRHRPDVAKQDTKTLRFPYAACLTIPQRPTSRNFWMPGTKWPCASKWKIRRLPRA